MNFKIREPKESDISFIYATWLNSYRVDSWAKFVSKTVFYQNYKKIIDEILLCATVRVACSDVDEDIILGYSVFSQDCIHYAFVKEPFRGFGIAKSLLNDQIKEHTIISHRTRHIIPFIQNKSITYNPFILYKGA